jgi:hypothetical protein
MQSTGEYELAMADNKTSPCDSQVEFMNLASGNTRIWPAPAKAKSKFPKVELRASPGTRSPRTK